MWRACDSVRRMNWLAHLFLSGPEPTCRIGNLLPDFLSANVLDTLPAEFQRGIAQHRRIDAYTDAHPVFRRSVNRFAPPFRRYGGILVDIFYDHFLARDWPTFTPTPLPTFAAEVYASFDTLGPDFPADALAPLHHMRHADWLCSYGEMRGLTHALQRLSQRLRRPFDLAAVMPHFEKSYAHFEADFREFFPQLRYFVSSAQEWRS